MSLLLSGNDQNGSFHQSPYAPSTPRLRSVATSILTLALVALSTGVVTGRLTLASVSISTAPAAPATTVSTAKAVPAGLQAAIHRVLGPGPISLGSAPVVAGIVPRSDGWAVQAPSQHLSATVGANGALAIHIASSNLVGTFTARMLGVEKLARAGIRSTSSETLRVESSVMHDGELLQRAGPVTTTYRVTAGGLEQQFTVSRPQNQGDQILLGLGNADGWIPVSGGRALVRTVSKSSEALTYGALRTTDATGAPLASQLRIVGGQAEIVVDLMSHTTFPLTIDPDWMTTSTSTAQLTAGQPADAFGHAVALSGDGTTAVVGATGMSHNTGAAYIFHTSSEGSWSTTATPTATLTVPTLPEDSFFGSSVTISHDGSTVIVSQVESAGGAAYVFQASSENSWSDSSSPVATLTHAAVNNFGQATSLSSDGTTALIGTGSAEAFVFHASSETSWATNSLLATLTNTGTFNDFSQVALSADGTIALIGVPIAHTAFIYRASTEGSWANSSTGIALERLGRRYGQFRSGRGTLWGRHHGLCRCSRGQQRKRGNRRLPREHRVVVERRVDTHGQPQRQRWR